MDIDTIKKLLAQGTPLGNNAVPYSQDYLSGLGTPQNFEKLKAVLNRGQTAPVTAQMPIDSNKPVSQLPIQQNNSQILDTDQRAQSQYENDAQQKSSDSYNMDPSNFLQKHFSDKLPQLNSEYNSSYADKMSPQDFYARVVDGRMEDPNYRGVGNDISTDVSNTRRRTNPNGVEQD